MNYENEIKHLMRELKFAKSDYLNARLKSEDALKIHAFKTDVETIEFQIEVFEKAAKVNKYEVKAKAFDEIKVYMQSAEDKLCDEEYFNEDVYEEYYGIIESVIEHHSEKESDESE